MCLHSDFYVSKNWDKACMDVIKAKPKEKLWDASHRLEPQMFPKSQSRPGTVIFPKETFGAYYNDFNSELFEQYAEEFVELNDFTISKGEGVSGLIKKKDWDQIGGNDPLFAPASWDDMDLFLRMLTEGYKFILTSRSLVWHFGARGSHRLEENNGQTSERQKKAEAENQRKWLSKWGSFPTFNGYGMINGLKN